MLSRHFFRFSYETSILWLFSIGINIRGIHKPKPFWNDESIYLKCNLRIKGRGFTCWSIKAIGLKTAQKNYGYPIAPYHKYKCADLT